MKCSGCWFRSLPSGLSAACPVASDASSKKVSDQLRFHGWSCQRQSHRRVRVPGRVSMGEHARLFVQRATAIRWGNVGFQKISYALVGVNLIFYFRETVAFVLIDFVFD